MAVLPQKKQLVKICGDDDPRSIYVDPEDLHPQSRLKRVINSVSDHVDIIWGCPRDTLISLIASQRYNKLIKRGETTYNEVILELDTDCVDTSDSKGEKLYHFHVESGILEYVLTTTGIERRRRRARALEGSRREKNGGFG